MLPSVLEGLHQQACALGILLCKRNIVNVVGIEDMGQRIIVETALERELSRAKHTYCRMDDSDAYRLVYWDLDVDDEVEQNPFEVINQMLSRPRRSWDRDGWIRDMFVVIDNFSPSPRSHWWRTRPDNFWEGIHKEAHHVIFIHDPRAVRAGNAKMIRTDRDTTEAVIFANGVQMDGGEYTDFDLIGFDFAERRRAREVYYQIQQFVGLFMPTVKWAPIPIGFFKRAVLGNGWQAGPRSQVDIVRRVMRNGEDPYMFREALDAAAAMQDVFRRLDEHLPCTRAQRLFEQLTLNNYGVAN